MPDKKIAYILSKFPVLTETFIIREIDELRKRGVDVRVYSLKNITSEKEADNETKERIGTTNYSPYFFSWKILSSLFHYFTKEPLVCINLISKIVATHVKNPIYLIKTIAVLPKGFSIARDLKEQKITKIHAHWATVPATIAWVIAKLNGFSFTFTAHAWDIYQLDIMLEDKLRDAQNVITISEYNKSYLKRKYPKLNPDKIKIIHCGIDLEKFKPASAHKKSIFTIVSVGRLTKKKGFDILLRACKLLIDNNLKFRCRIVYVRGDYDKEFFELYKSLELKEYVELISELKQDELLKIYSNADLFVLPCIISEDNDRDGIPVVILEALSMKIPVISTNVSGIPEVVINNETGILVEPNDPSRLAQEITRLSLDKDLREKLGVNGNRLVKKQFELSSNVDRLVTIFFNTLV